MGDEAKLGHGRRGELVSLLWIIRLLVLVLRFEPLDFLRDFGAVVALEPDFRPVTSLAEIAGDDVDHSLQG